MWKFIFTLLLTSVVTSMLNMFSKYASSNLAGGCFFIYVSYSLIKLTLSVSANSNES